MNEPDDAVGLPAPTISSADVQKIVNAYGKAMGRRGGVIRDESGLPFPKALIKQALIAVIRMTPESPGREQLRSGYVMLGDWQNLKQDDPVAAMVAECKALLEELRSLGL